MKTRVYITDIAPLDDRKLYDRLFSVMPADRRENITSFGSVQDRKLSLGAGVLLKKALLDAGIADPGVPFKNPCGKPYYPLFPGFNYSISHSGSLAVCLVSGSEAGIDIEFIRETDTLGIAGRFFTSGEVSRIKRKRTEKSRREMFFRLWTLKESYLKAAGTGFSVSPSSFSLTPDGNGAWHVNDAGGAYYGLREIDCPDGYRCSCCMKDMPQGLRPEPETVNLESVFTYEK